MTGMQLLLAQVPHLAGHMNIPFFLTLFVRNKAIECL